MLGGLGIAGSERTVSSGVLLVGTLSLAVPAQGFLKVFRYTHIHSDIATWNQTDSHLQAQKWALSSLWGQGSGASQAEQAPKGISQDSTQREGLWGPSSTPTFSSSLSATPALVSVWAHKLFLRLRTERNSSTNLNWILKDTKIKGPRDQSAPEAQCVDL